MSDIPPSILILNFVMSFACMVAFYLVEKEYRTLMKSVVVLEELLKEQNKITRRKK